MTETIDRLNELIIDKIMDDWDNNYFEIEFAKEVERIITLKAEKANKAYIAAQKDMKG